MNRFKILMLLLLGLFFSDCQAQSTGSGKGQMYGKPLTAGTSVAMVDLPKVLGSKNSVAVKVTGQVVDVCQAKGCWMDVKLTNNSVMKVRFKDYGFFVPKDIKGRTVVINGLAYNQSISVADQRHYAKDAGKSVAEINAITKPNKSITFTADGVLIK